MSTILTGRLLSAEEGHVSSVSLVQLEVASSHACEPAATTCLVTKIYDWIHPFVHPPPPDHVCSSNVRRSVYHVDRGVGRIGQGVEVTTLTKGGCGACIDGSCTFLEILLLLVFTLFSSAVPSPPPPQKFLPPQCLPLNGEPLPSSLLRR